MSNLAFKSWIGVLHGRATAEMCMSRFPLCHVSDLGKSSRIPAQALNSDSELIITLHNVKL